MHIRSEDEKEKRRSERDKKIVLNIPVKGKKEIRQSEIYKGSSLLGYDSDDIDILQQDLEGFHISYNGDRDYEDSSPSDGETEELKKNVVPKGPIRCENTGTRLTSQPYPIQIPNPLTRRERLQSGGDLIGTNLDPYITISTSNYLIPKPVSDYVSPSNDVPNDVGQLYSTLNDDEKEKLNEAIDRCLLSEKTEITSGNSKMGPKDLELMCNSPDSSYETMSPSSIPPPSPYSLHSPNPLNEKLRLSESDSLTSESELSQRELTYEISLPRSSGFIISARPRQFTTNHIQPRVPIATLNAQLLKPIQPDSKVIVHEYGLIESAMNRLKKEKIVSAAAIDSEWQLTIKETNSLEQLIQNEQKRKISDYEREQIKMKKYELRKSLIDLIKEKPKRPCFYERLYSRIKVYHRSYLDILTGKDDNGHTPLYVAAIERYDCPLIARLIMDHMQNIDTKLDEEENTILHYLAQLGDSHAHVLSELLHSNGSGNEAKVNKANIMSDTALHKAVRCHGINNKSCLATVKQLIKHGASLNHQDFKRQTPLHLALMLSGDPLLLKSLLASSTARRAVNLVDIDGNTALHIAASRNDLTFMTQRVLIQCLVESGAKHGSRNNQEKYAVSLLDKDRQELKNIIQK